MIQPFRLNEILARYLRKRAKINENIAFNQPPPLNDRFSYPSYTSACKYRQYPPLGSAPGIPPVPVEEFRRDHLWSSSSPKERINKTVMHLMMLATVLQV